MKIHMQKRRFTTTKTRRRLPRELVWEVVKFVDLQKWPKAGTISVVLDSYVDEHFWKYSLKMMDSFKSGNSVDLRQLHEYHKEMIAMAHAHREGNGPPAPTTY